MYTVANQNKYQIDYYDKMT